jgi:arginase family enzyme
MASTANSLVLNFDDSVLALPSSQVLELARHQEAIRFGCSMKTMRELAPLLDPALHKDPSVVFMGSGDYHHISWLLLQRYQASAAPIQVMVLDNHPDNMRYPWGIHCGSWVHHVSRLPFVAQVNVLGITSPDVEVLRSWENHLGGLRSGNIRYWCVGRDLGWMRHFGIQQSNSFDSVADLLQALETHLKLATMPIYLSIDKDVLSPDDAHTNWDQGVMRLSEMLQAIDLMQGRIIGSDVTGEVSVYQYQSRFKQFLSDLDSQPEITQAELLSWQTQHQAINLALQQRLAPQLSF